MFLTDKAARSLKNIAASTLLFGTAEDRSEGQNRLPRSVTWSTVTLSSIACKIGIYIKELKPENVRIDKINKVSECSPFGGALQISEPFLFFRLVDPGRTADCVTAIG